MCLYFILISQLLQVADTFGPYRTLFLIFSSDMIHQSSDAKSTPASVLGEVIYFYFGSVFTMLPKIVLSDLGVG